jgi:hypothetical protein
MRWPGIFDSDLLKGAVFGAVVGLLLSYPTLRTGLSWKCGLAGDLLAAVCGYNEYLQHHRTLPTAGRVAYLLGNLLCFAGLGLLGGWRYSLLSTRSDSPPYPTTECRECGHKWTPQVEARCPKCGGGNTSSTRLRAKPSRPP